MKKIMFNDQYGLTQAVLDGRKTQTRRAIRLKDGEYVNVVALDNGSFMSYVAKKGCLTAHVGDIELPEYVRPLTPNYFIGTEVAVAQRYSECNRAVCLLDSKGWNNKMFTKAILLPHRIRIINIRVERLQDISDEDCLKEGIDRCEKEWGYWEGDNGFLNFYACDTIKEAFAALINKTCGNGTWESNPYVFVYDFILIK